MRIFRLFVASLVLAASASAPSTAEETSDSSKIAVMEGVLKSIQPDQGTITLRLQPPFNDKTLAVVDRTAPAKLTEAKPGDIIKSSVDDATKPGSLTKLQEMRRPVDGMPRILALIGSLALILALAMMMIGGSPRAFIIGVDNRYSNSQTQLALWFTTVASVYAATVVLRLIYLGNGYIGGVGITTNLLALTGLSALSFGGAKVITAQKVENATKPNEPVPKSTAARPNLLTDLVQNDLQQADLGDFEMILITLAAVSIFTVSAYYFLGELKLEATVTLPDVDTTLLASFGIGHGAYLAKKAALKPGEG